MDNFTSLKAKTKISPSENYKSFRAAALAVASLKTPPTWPSRADLLSEISQAYSLIADNLIAAQKFNEARRRQKTDSVAELILRQPKDLSNKDYRRKVTEAALNLAYASVLFHLNFFEPNFLGLTEETKFQKCLRQMTILFKQKNRDYGNSFRFWGIPGLLVRLGDKIFRLQQLTTRGYKQKVKDERIPDTALDLANYALMLLMLLAEGRSLKLGQ